jgi:hypothetical protein
VLALFVAGLGALILLVDDGPSKRDKFAAILLAVAAAPTLFHLSRAARRGAWGPLGAAQGLGALCAALVLALGLAFSSASMFLCTCSAVGSVLWEARGGVDTDFVVAVCLGLVIGGASAYVPVRLLFSLEPPGRRSLVISDERQAAGSPPGDVDALPAPSGAGFAPPIDIQQPRRSDR